MTNENTETRLIDADDCGEIVYIPMTREEYELDGLPYAFEDFPLA